MPDRPLPVNRTYSLEDTDWQNAFAEPDGRPGHLLRQDALSELDRVQSPAYQAMKQNFSQIDFDKDGFLNSDEISLAAEKDTDLSELAEDRKTQWEIKRLAKDGKHDGRGISASDVDAYGAQLLNKHHAENDPKDLKLACEFLDKYFNKIDRSKSGMITKEDLGELIVDPSLKFDFRQRFLLVERYFEGISEQHKDKVLKIREHSGISQKDLKTLIAREGRVIRQ